MFDRLPYKISHISQIVKYIPAECSKESPFIWCNLIGQEIKKGLQQLYIQLIRSNLELDIGPFAMGQWAPELCIRSYLSLERTNP